MIKKNLKKLNLRERIYKRIFIAGDRYREYVTRLNGFCRFFFTISLGLFLLGSIFYFGFSGSPENLERLKSSFRILFLLLYISKYLPELLSFRRPSALPAIFRSLVFIYCTVVLLTNFGFTDNRKLIWSFFSGNSRIIPAIILMGISEISGLFPMIRKTKIPPALIFAFSFILIILVGSGLLMLPNSHSGSLTFLDSLFTSVSAVCVTGLVTVDTSAAFTFTGKLIILCLIQIGGLGIMTFTGFFSYIFTSRSTFSDRMFLREIFSSESMSNLFKLLSKIILLTFLIEVAGALFIYTSLNSSFGDRFFFAVFHSVSAFCNAGFSTMPDNLASTVLRTNSMLQVAVALLIVLGGVGFPVLIGIYSSFKHFLVVLINKILQRRTPVKPEQQNIPSRIVWIMTFILIAGGAAGYYFLEAEKTLNGSDTIHKIIGSLFASISARTAGFNIINLSGWYYPTIYLMIFLMWIGASPGSTGGGIKTTTFAIAARAAWNTVRGGDRLKIGNREIGHNTIKRVLAIIILSLLIISAGFFSLLLSEPGKDPSHLLFECFSAYSTVGLSMVNSSTLSDQGKLVDILLMFIGRVGPLTLLTGFVPAYRRKYSAYPEIEIVIN